MSDISKAAQKIQAGGLVAFPTETVYGLGADALNPYAVAAIFEAKNRPTFDPLIVHIADLSQAQPLVDQFPQKALQLAQVFWPGPLSIVLPKSSRVPDIVTSSLPHVAIRIPNHPIALELLRQSKRPIAAPSANPFGQVSPTTAEHVRKSLGDKVDLILDGGPCQVGVESTIVSFAEKEPLVLRLGGLALEEIESLIGKIMVPTLGHKPMAPGQLLQHYSPQTPLRFIQTRDQQPHSKIGWLGFQNPPAGFETFEILSPQGDLREAAANLFAAMRRLDEKNLDLILVEPVPHQGLGRAINDRLYRASQK